MKIQFKIISLALFGATLIGCNPKEGEVGIKNVQLSDDGNNVKEFLKYRSNWIFGETVVPVNKMAMVLPKIDPNKINWGQIKRTDGVDINYLAYGGDLTAGVRDGGLYRESQETSFPALIANQLGISNFRQPLFSMQEGNGSGYKVITQTKPTLEYAVVTNNLALKQRNSEGYVFGKGTGDFDNIGVPFASDIYHSSEKFNPSYFNGSNDYMYRIEPNPKKGIITLVNEKKKIDLFTYETFTNRFTQTALQRNISRLDYEAINENTSSEIDMIAGLKDRSKWGLVLNLPDVLDFPIFHVYSIEDIKRLSGKTEILVQNRQGTALVPVTSEYLFLPTEFLLEDIKDGVINTASVLEKGEISVVGYNKSFVQDNLADKRGITIVDLYTLYKKIHSDTYVTNDGVKVNPAFPTGGNFYSADGMSPTAFGQAVIANECIRMLNKTYNANIQLIETKLFLKK